MTRISWNSSSEKNTPAAIHSNRATPGGPRRAWGPGDSRVPAMPSWSVPRRGGKRDGLAPQHSHGGARTAFFEETAVLSLPIDHDDSLAADPELRVQDVSLLIHGAQPAGAEAARAVRRPHGVSSYGRD